MLAIASVAFFGVVVSIIRRTPGRFGNARRSWPNYEITISASPEWRTLACSAVFAITAPSESEAKGWRRLDDTVQSFGGPRSSRSGRPRGLAAEGNVRPRGRSFRSLAHHEGGPREGRSSPRPSTARTTRWRRSTPRPTLVTAARRSGEARPGGQRLLHHRPRSHRRRGAAPASPSSCALLHRLGEGRSAMTRTGSSGGRWTSLSEELRPPSPFGHERLPSRARPEATSST